jgi:hypothetical protein
MQRIVRQVGFAGEVGEGDDDARLAMCHFGDTPPRAEGARADRLLRS